MVDISRDPRWGRVMEGAGEDTYLGSQIAKARIKGFQGEKLGGTDAVMATAKHFAAYGAAVAGRDYNAVDMSDHMLWETYLHRVFAREVAEKSIVLLKNETSTLPLAKKTKKVALIEPLIKAKRDLDGSWTVQADTTEIVSLFEEIEEKVSKQTQLLYAKGCDVNCTSSDGFAAAIAAAKQADVVVMALGETWDMSGEAKSRTDLGLPGQQEALYNAIKATGKPIVVVLMAGRPMIFNEIADDAPAILYAWWLGSEAGNAIANVIFGDYNPSGKLPITFPRSVGQIPISYSHQNTGRPVTDPQNIVYRSAYIDSPNTPRYAFGYGLSYTTFSYSNLKVSKKAITTGETAEFSFTLKNTGKTAGEEVVQLYIQDLVASVVRPVKELKDFQKVMLSQVKVKPLHLSLMKKNYPSLIASFSGERSLASLKS